MFHVETLSSTRSSHQKSLAEHESERTRNDQQEGEDQNLVLSTHDSRRSGFHARLRTRCNGHQAAELPGSAPPSAMIRGSDGVGSRSGGNLATQRAGQFPPEPRNRPGASSATRTGSDKAANGISRAREQKSHKNRVRRPGAPSWHSHTKSLMSTKRMVLKIASSTKKSITRSASENMALQPCHRHRPRRAPVGAWRVFYAAARSM